MKKSILINYGTQKHLLITNNMSNHDLFQLVGFIKSNLCHPKNYNLDDKDIIMFAKSELNLTIEKTNLIAEININKP